MSTATGTRPGAVTDSATMLRRNLRHMQRYPSLTLLTAALPIVFLLIFVYVFGGTLGSGLGHGTLSGRAAYIAYVAPGILIYTVAIGAGHDADSAAGLTWMTGISETSGAHMFYGNRVELADIAEKIGIELRNRYVIGYSPKDPKRDGKYHRIEVKVFPPRGLPKLTAHWRNGYYAPSN